jgi:hypothetical protein
MPHKLRIAFAATLLAVAAGSAVESASAYPRVDGSGIDCLDVCSLPAAHGPEPGGLFLPRNGEAKLYGP